MRVFIPSLCCPKNKTGKSSEDFWRRIEGHFEPEGGEDTSVHMTVFRVMHCTTEKKRGGRSCFEEAQDSYGLEANYRRRPQRDNSNV